ncbi:Type II secretion system (T2SS), protein F [Nocardioides exalbidus]|uniref:Type II secretion system (T2SS), protein F n=1 Tax=Nocardioides exalbidus TaxID=402596 RepID=A0A1H4QLI5_9ACTN|nr:type II secretion system F family protein [Nocardioides exalbidus]SEC20473.1 Type II secretion system (T2SS), protein F [Nocardioides exalbidus]
MIWLSALCAALAVAVLAPPVPQVVRPRPSSGSPVRPLAAVGAGIGAWLLVGGLPGAVAGAVAALVARRILANAEPSSVRRDREEAERTLPHLVDLFAATLRAGAEPVAGLAQACWALPGPAADRLAPVVERARWGAAGAEAWSAVADDDVLAPLARAMVRSQVSGASVVHAVERLADELERESLARAEDAARKVGVSAALPLGVCLLPAFLLLGVVPTVASLFSTVAP